MLNQPFINNGPSNEMQMTRSKINQELTNFLCKVASRNLTNQFQFIHSYVDKRSLRVPLVYQSQGWMLCEVITGVRCYLGRWNRQAALHHK